MATQPVDDNGNYSQPTTLAGPTKFTGVATANTPESATEQAKQIAQTTATNTFGPLQTEFVSFDQTRIVINGTGTGPFTYTATVVTNAIQIPPPSVTGFSEAQQAEVLKENNQILGENPITPEEQQQLQQAGTPVEINVPTQAQIAFNETNAVELPNIIDDPLANRQNQIFLEASIQPEAIPVATIEQERFLQANVAPETIDDPFEIARIDAENRALRAGPTEQAVIDAEDDPFEKARIEAAQRTTRPAPDPNEGESQDTGTQEARASGKNAQEQPLPRFEDWRFRISLAARNADYFYNVAGDGDILAPLKATNGVIYPYTPNISVSYNANYEPTDLAHTNYKIYNYKNSSVESITITGDFTAQDTNEANYLLAVIHFFRCATKMFYGKDLNPIRGTPPPLCYLNGHGTYGFNEHPVAITNFTLNYPTDVDYINAGVNFGTTSSNFLQSKNFNPTKTRLQAAKLQPGGVAQSPGFTQSAKLPPVTRVPTKLQITINCIPIISRYDISNRFSLKEYATGNLLLGNINTRKGIW